MARLRVYSTGVSRRVTSERGEPQATWQPTARASHGAPPLRGRLAPHARRERAGELPAARAGTLFVPQGGGGSGAVVASAASTGARNVVSLSAEKRMLPTSTASRLTAPRPAPRGRWPPTRPASAHRSPRAAPRGAPAEGRTALSFPREGARRSAFPRATTSRTPIAASRSHRGRRAEWVLRAGCWSARNTRAGAGPSNCVRPDNYEAPDRTPFLPSPRRNIHT